MSISGSLQLSPGHGGEARGPSPGTDQPSLDLAPAKGCHSGSSQLARARGTPPLPVSFCCGQSAEWCWRERCLQRGITTFRQQRNSLRPRKAGADNAWMVAHLKRFLLFHAWDSVSFPLDHQCSLLMRSSSKYTSSLPANCLIWAGISPVQDQTRVPQIWINCFLPLRCQVSGQDTLHLPEICHYHSPLLFQCPPGLPWESQKGLESPLKGMWVPTVSHVQPPILAPNAKDDTALVITRRGAHITPPNQPPIKT